jgi:hypothetical protein
VRWGCIDGRKINVDVKVRKEWFYRGDHFRDKGKPFFAARDRLMNRP